MGIFSTNSVSFAVYLQAKHFLIPWSTSDMQTTEARDRLHKWFQAGCQEDCVSDSSFWGQEPCTRGIRFQALRFTFTPPINKQTWNQDDCCWGGGSTPKIWPFSLSAAINMFQTGLILILSWGSIGVCALGSWPKSHVEMLLAEQGKKNAFCVTGVWGQWISCNSNSVWKKNSEAGAAKGHNPKIGENQKWKFSFFSLENNSMLRSFGKTFVTL